MKPSLRLLAATLPVLLAPSTWALSIHALTPANQLLLIDSEVPAHVLSVRTITGLDLGDNLVGIDVRPATGQLYALSGDASLYTIDPNTGVATKVADLAADPADVAAPFYTGLTGTDFGIDFNPVVDRLRVVSNADENLRINPVTGLVNADLPLAYAAGDVNAAANPGVGDAAYTNNFLGATSTTLFVIDDTTFALATQNPPNNGTLVTPAGDPFGDPLARHAGFDIAPNGTAYIVGVHLFPSGTEYVLVAGDTTTGAADSHGAIGDGTIPIRDIAVAPTISFSAENYAIAEDGGSATITVRREGFVNVPTTLAVQFTTQSDTASAASDYLTASGTLTFPVKPVTTSADTSDTLTFQVPVINDAFPENDERLDLFLTGVSSGQGVVGFPASATLRINANDLRDRVGPQVVSIGLTGPSRGIDGAVVHFNEDMDPVTATNLANYRFVAFRRNGTRVVMPFTSAVYDPVGRRVTLGLAPFAQTGFIRTALRVRGGAGQVADLTGNLLDGDRNSRRGGDAVQIFEVFSGTTVRLTDRDGDQAVLEIADGGRIDGVRPIGGPRTQLTQFWILDPIALRSTLTGRVTRTPTSNGIIVIAEIIGLDKKEFTPLLTNPSFRVNTLTFSSNATGL